MPIYYRALLNFVLTTTGATALGDFMGGALMIATQMKIQPRRGSVQLPHARWHAPFDDLIGATRMAQAAIGPKPHTRSVRIDFTLPVTAAAAGTVAKVFGALGLRA